MKLNSNFSSKNPDSYWSEIVDKTMTLFHESFIHADLHTKDYLDDGLMNHSNVSDEVKSAAGYNENHYEHYKVGMEQNNGQNNLWPQQAFDAMKGINSQYPKPNLYSSDKEISNKLWDFNVGEYFKNYKN